MIDNCSNLRSLESKVKRPITDTSVNKAEGIGYFPISNPTASPSEVSLLGKGDNNLKKRENVMQLKCEQGSIIIEFRWSNDYYLQNQLESKYLCPDTELQLIL